MNNGLSHWLGTSLRLGMDFVSAILLGTLIGRGVDFYLGSKPFGLVIFILFGIMAGSLTVYRSAKQIMLNK